MLIESREVRSLKIVSGEFDLAGWDMPLQEFSLYKENEKSMNALVEPWPQLVAARTGIHFNYEVKDPVLKEIFNDIRFRQAMSVAADRPNINKVLAYGKAVPMQAAPTPKTSFYKDWMGNTMLSTIRIWRINCWMKWD